MKYKLLLLLFVFLISSPIICQDYYPLGIGNIWYNSYDPTIIDTTISYNGKTYFRSITVYEENYFRSDDTGNVYELKNGIDSLYYKLGAEIGESWQRNSGRLKFLATLESKTDTIEIWDTLLTNCYRVRYRGINVIDADTEIWFAKGIGIVKHHSVDWGSTGYLAKAEVGGLRYPWYTVPPKLFESIPKDDQIDIPVDTELNFRFNFMIIPECISTEYILLKNEAGEIVEGEFDVSSQYGRIIFKPAGTLEYNHNYTINISRNIRDYMGDKLSNPITIKFKTEEYRAPQNVFVIDTLFTLESNNSCKMDIADYQSDGDLDIILFRTSNAGSEEYDHVIEILVNENNVFTPQQSMTLLAGNHELGDVQWLDLNSDNKLDFAISWRKESGDKTEFYINNNGNFIIDDSKSIEYGNGQIAVADYNHDSYPDLLISGIFKQLPGNIALYKNATGTPSYIPVEYFPEYVVKFVNWFDYDHDGIDDIYFCSQNLEHLSILVYNNGFQQINKPVISDVYLNYSFGNAVCDFDQDNDVDLIIDGNLVIQNENDFTVNESALEKLNNSFAEFSDYNGDGYEDIFIVGEKRDPVGRYKQFFQIYTNNSGAFELSESFILSDNTYIHDAEWIDLDNNGMLDFVNVQESNLLLYKNVRYPAGSKEELSAPDGFLLMNNYPNPFNTTTTIQFEIVESADVKLEIYNILGEKTAVLFNKRVNRGNYSSVFEAGNLPSGIYLYKLTAGQITKTNKCLFIK